MRRLDEKGPDALLQLSEPVNKFPDFIRYLVQRLKILCPAMGKVRIAETLCRAGLHLGATTVGRILKEEHRPSPGGEAQPPLKSWVLIGQDTSGMWTSQPFPHRLALGPPGFRSRFRSSGRFAGG